MADHSPQPTGERRELLCGCTTHCGDDGDIDGPGTCKGLPIEKRPLVKVVLVRRDA